MFERRQTETADAFRAFLSLRTALHMRREDLLAARMDGAADERFGRQFAMVNHAALRVGGWIDHRRNYLPAMFFLLSVVSFCQNLNI